MAAEVEGLTVCSHYGVAAKNRRRKCPYSTKRNEPGATMISCFFERTLKNVRSFCDDNERKIESETSKQNKRDGVVCT